MKRIGRRRAPRVLVIAAAIPGADSSAGERRLVRIVGMLAERADVELVSVGPDRPGDEPERIRALQSIERVKVPYGGRPVHLPRVLAGRSYGLILVEAWTTAELALPIVRRHQPRAVVAVDTVDLHFLRDARAAAATGLSDPRREIHVARELKTYGAADVRIFVSDAERALYEGLSGAVTTGNTVIPIIVEERSPSPRAPRPSEVVFVGPMWHFPNHDGLSWLCSEIWPQVRRTVPDAHLRIVGSNAWAAPVDTSPFTDCPGVTLAGFVPRLSDVYAEAAVAVAPLRFGAGMKGKVCEAMAAAVPVVTTTVGAEGIRAVPGRDLLVADDPDGFARGIATLLEDDRMAASIGMAGAEAVQLQCGPAVVRPAVHALLGDVAPPARSSAGRATAGQLPRLAVSAGWRVARRLQALRQLAAR